MTPVPQRKQTANSLRDDLQELRKAASRADAAKRLKIIAADASAFDAENSRRQAVQAIVALATAYDRAEPIPDRLWAEAINRVVDWGGEEG